MSNNGDLKIEVKKAGDGTAMTTINGKVYNLGSREVVGLQALAELLAGMTPDGSYELVPFPPERKAIDIGDYYSDFSLIERELGWTPKIGLAEGLTRTLAYYRAHGAHYWDADA